MPYPTNSEIRPAWRVALSATASSARWLAAVLVLAAVLSLYGHPDFVVQLANQLWTCF